MNLTEATIAQWTWKTATMQKVATRVLKTALRQNEFWPDEIDFSDVADDDRNCIGSVFRTLRGLGIIEQTGEYRRSTGYRANGRTVFQYYCQRPPLARSLLNRTCPAEKQAYHQAELIS